MPTDKEYAQEEEFLQGLPFFNWGALLMPPIWGPGHGEFLVILFYPMWLFVDNLIYAAVHECTPLSIVLAVAALAVILLATVAYGRLSQPKAAHAAADAGKTREEYLATERKWAVACGIIAVVFLVLATVYNLTIRPNVGA